MSKPTHVAHLITSGPPTLQTLLARAAYLATLTRSVRTILSAPLNQHCSVANIKDTTLVMTTDGATWATLLRYQAGAVLDGLRGAHNLTQLRELRVKIAPPAAP